VQGGQKFLHGQNMAHSHVPRAIADWFNTETGQLRYVVPYSLTIPFMLEEFHTLGSTAVSWEK